jgi:ubiquitin carboxyl-terminal hydrolase 5/13
LAEHLAHWGTDIQKHKKTDKSLAEMELEINKSVGAEYAAIMESGESLEPAYGPGRTGIVNLGNTCYISSILQALFAMDDFKSVFGKKNEFEPEPVNNIKTQISRIGPGLIGGEYSKPISTPDGKKLNDEQMGISPGLFKSVVAQGNADFAGNQQQDASEFLLHFFDVLEKESKNGSFTSPGKNFEFQFEERLEVNKKVQYKNINETIFGIPIDESDAINQSDVEAYLKKKQDTIESGTTEPEMVRASIPFAKCLSRWAEPEAIENYKSQSDGKLYTAQRRLRFATFPKYLLLQSRRFTIGDNWQPKKLNVSLDFPDTLDLSDMRANGEQPGEQMMDTSNEPTGPTIDENLVNQLVEMGYPYHASRKALYHTSQQLEAALEWLMIHVGDLDFDSPLVVKGNEPSKQTFSPESIIMVTSMGFSEIQAQNALEATSGNVEMAIDWIFTNPELSLQPSGTNKSDPPAGSDQLTSDSSKYELVAFVSHMGTSTSCGHYVAHVKNQAKEDDQSDWIIFNDNKVAFSKSPPRDLAYLYFYRQI